MSGHATDRSPTRCARRADGAARRGDAARAGSAGAASRSACIAFVITLPPFEVRTAVPSLVLGRHRASFCGVVAVARRREAASAAARSPRGVFGALGAFGATQSGVTHLEVVVSLERAAAPRCCATRRR